MGKYPVDRTGRRDAQNRRALHHGIQGPPSCLHHARAEQKRIPGPNRRGGRGSGFHTVQRGLRFLHIRRTAPPGQGQPQQDGIPPSRRLCFCGDPLQLHCHCVQPRSRPRADGEHGALETCGHVPALQLLPDENLREGRPSRRGGNTRTWREYTSPGPRTCSRSCGCSARKTCGTTGPSRGS